MATFLLVHGAWHDSHAWSLLAPELETLGHRVVAPTLPDHEPGSRVSPFKGSMDRYAGRVHDAARDIIESEGKPPLCVGHSMAGFVISLAAEQRPDLFRQLIFLTAFVPNKNEGRLFPQILNDKVMRKRIGNTRFNVLEGTNSVKPERAADFFYHDCPEDVQTEAIARLVPEPMKPLMSKVKLSPAKFGTVPAAYIECADDQAIPIHMQRRMQASQTFAQIVSLPSAHSPFLSMPERLARVLDEIARA